MSSATTHRVGTLTGAVIAFALAVCTFALFVRSYPGQFSDEQTMQFWAAHFGSDVPTNGWLGQNQFAVLAVIGLVLAAICIGRRSARLAAHATLLVLGAVITAVVLKTGLDRPSFGVGATTNSFPSNTVAAFGAAAFALISVSPKRVRRLVGFIALTGSLIVSVAVVGLQWHRPSDVVGGWLVAVAAAFAAESFVPVRGRLRSAGVRQVASTSRVPWRS